MSHGLTQDFRTMNTAVSRRATATPEVRALYRVNTGSEQLLAGYLRSVAPLPRRYPAHLLGFASLNTAKIGKTSTGGTHAAQAQDRS